MDIEILEDLLFDVKKEALERGYNLVLKTRGRSMFPVLSTKDSIAVVKCDKDNFRYGDIILYRPGHNKKVLVAHRFIRKIKKQDRYMFITKGDTSFGFDLPVDPDDVIGRIIKIRKSAINIPLYGFIGRPLNLFMYFFSITRITALAYMFLRKLKRLILRIVS